MSWRSDVHAWRFARCVSRRGLTLVCCLIALALPAAAPQPASAPAPPRRTVNGSIHGRVEFRVNVAERERRVNPADLGMAAAHGSDDRQRSVVYLDPAPRAAFDARDEPRARLDQREESFVPHVLAVVAGTTVDFPNSDRTYHNVFSLSKTRSFDLGRYAAGHSKAVRFDKPGIVRVFCDIHSHMSAFVLVFAHRYFAVTDDRGRFRIDNVPPGTYTVLAWNEAMSAEPRRATVPEAGGDVELSFLFEKR
jgi:plastocyanin